VKKTLIIIKCLVLLFLTEHCCRKETKNDSSLINIETGIFKMQKLYISQYASNIWYVPLEDKPDVPLYWTTSNLTDVNERYILTSDARKCLLYDKAGRYIRQIGDQGRGPGEYSLIVNVFLNNDKIYIRDYYDLIEYSIDGTFMKRCKNIFIAEGKFHLEESIVINDSMIFGNIENASGYDEYKALMVNHQGKAIFSYRNYITFALDPGVSHAKSPGKALIFIYKNNIFFKELLNDTLFKMDDQYRLIPYSVLNLGKYKQPLALRGKRWNQINLRSYINLNNIFYTGRYLILICNFNSFFPAKRLTPGKIFLPGLDEKTLWYNTTLVLGVVDNKTQDVIFSEPTSTNNHLYTSGFYNDFDAGPRFLPDKSINDSTLIMKIRFDHLVEHIESDDFKSNYPDFPERKKKLEMFVDSLRNINYNNPIYMFVTFKNK